MVRSLPIFILLICFVATAQAAELKPALPFQDHMVLQAGLPVPVWGKADPGETVTVRFAGQEVAGTAAQDGKEKGQWRLVLKPLGASSEPAAFTIAGAKKTLTLKDVLVGEVWVCSGQSNMQWPVKNSMKAKEEMAAADFPRIRMLTTGGKGRWVVSSPKTVGNFSAVGYFFARKLHKDLATPVGILNGSQGGTRIQPWMTPESARAVPALQSHWKALAKQVAAHRAAPKAYAEAFKKAKAAHQEAKKKWEKDQLARDAGLVERWFDPQTPVDGWTRVRLPMADQADGLNTLGTIWLRVTATVPQDWVGKAVKLNLGPIDEIDTTYVNGQKVGYTGRETKDFWKVPRHYTVPATLMTSTSVTVAIQMYNAFGHMGLFGTDDQMSLVCEGAAKEKTVSLAVEWRMREGLGLDVSTQPALGLTQRPRPNGEFGYLYHAKIAPVVPYAVRGVLWYQGESNSQEPKRYGELKPSLITGWRAAWGQKQLPWCSVLLAGFQGKQQLPVELHSWAELREAQMTSLALPQTGVVVASDLGDGADIHPRNKQEVGRRLALWALATQYGKPVEYSGPRLVRHKVEGNSMVLHFDHAEGLRLEGADQAGFAIAGADKVFRAATAVVRDGAVVVTARDPKRVPMPVAVRYGWAYHPVCFIRNAAGLPATQFRTDTWAPGEFRVE